MAGSTQDAGGDDGAQLPGHRELGRRIGKAKSVASWLARVHHPAISDAFDGLASEVCPALDATVTDRRSHPARHAIRRFRCCRQAPIKRTFRDQMDRSRASADDTRIA
jgi:hypothetical protein